MSGPATRTRWLELRGLLDAAFQGRRLLDEKREALLAESLRQRRRAEESRVRALDRLDLARRLLREAEVELGPDAVEAAALAQPAGAEAELRRRRLAGVPLYSASLREPGWAPCYGLAGTSSRLDGAGKAFAELVPLLVAQAAEEHALRTLERSLARTNRRLNALEKVIVPSLERELRDTAAALEEDERDEAYRRKLAVRGR